MQINDKIEFGKFEHQDTEERLPIEWRVIALEDDKALLLSEEVLFEGQLVEGFGGKRFSWETSPVRLALNDIFLNTFFTDEEKEKILKTEVVTDGETTTDSFFILSEEELYEYLPNREDRIAIFEKFGSPNNKGRIGTIRSQIYPLLIGGMPKDSNLSEWCLRTKGIYDDYAKFVIGTGIENPDFLSGNVYDTGCWAHVTNGIRPAFWMSII